MKVGATKFQRAVFIKERALEMVHQHGRLVRIHNRGVARELALNGLSIWYADPETADCDDYHHLDLHSDRRKVFSIAWQDGAQPEVVSFKSGPWEEVFLS